ncbi:MAG: DNA methyltransferase, partial [Gammaproteobacteria bacterium]
SGSIFVQIGDENVHRVRALLDEVFGEENFVSEIVLKTTSGAGSPTGGTISLASVHDYVLWYARKREKLKYHQLHSDKADMQSAELYRRVLLPSGEDRLATVEELSGTKELPESATLFRPDNLTSQSSPESATFLVDFRGRKIGPGKGGWKTNAKGMKRLVAADRIYVTRNASLQYVRKWNDFNIYPINDVWTDVGTGSFTTEKVYVVQTNEKIVARCLLMSTDPGDLVLDPTCGSGTTAYVAEQWGRRWITIDTSRVALVLARARIMGARYPFYLLADSSSGRQKTAEIMHTPPSAKPTHGDIRHGFVYDRIPHIMLKDIANNTEIDVIWERFQEEMEPIREAMNEKRGLEIDEWQIPREAGDPWPRKARKQHGRFMRVTTDATRQKAVNRINEIMDRDYTIDTVPEYPVDPWTDPELLDLHQRWWELRIERQKEIDVSISAKAEFEYRYDKPCADPKIVRVAGPFTVESLSPHRTLGVDENDELIDPMEVRERPDDYAHLPEFGQMVLENLRMAGVQQAHKEDRIEFTSLRGWPGTFISAEGRYQEGAREKRAGIFIGPEFGTVRRADLVDAAREAGDADFDVVIACAFNYEPYASELDKLGRVPVLKARMNADLHMADDLKNTGSGNLFVIFGEPDIDLLQEGDAVRVKINGVDVFDPSTGEVRSDDADGIACWFVDTDYNGESFFVRQAYFLGANDPYKALKTTLRAEIDEDAWESLHRETSRPFPRPSTGRVAVKVINHLGDEVMKVFRV